MSDYHLILHQQCMKAKTPEIIDESDILFTGNVDAPRSSFHCMEIGCSLQSMQKFGFAGGLACLALYPYIVTTLV